MAEPTTARPCHSRASPLRPPRALAAQAPALPALAVLAGLSTLAALPACDVVDAVPRGARSLADAFQPPSPEEAVDLALDKYSPDNRYRGLAILANAPFGGGEPYIDLYVDSLDDDDSGVRQAAIRALGLHGRPDHVPLILERLEEENALVRAESARALQRLHNPQAIPALLKHIQPRYDRDPAVRAESAHALGQYRQPRVLASLIAALDDTSLAVNRNALLSLETLTGQNFGLDSKDWINWIDQHNQPPERLFAAGRTYTYPGYERDRRLIEYLPFVPDPPKETESPPVGLPREAGVVVPIETAPTDEPTTTPADAPADRPNNRPAERP